MRSRAGEMRGCSIILILGWCACTAPKPDDRAAVPDQDAGASSTAGRAGSAGASGSGTGGATDGGGDAPADASSAGTTGTGGGADGGADADAPEGGSCPRRCPASTPICSNGACRAVTQLAVGGLHACALIDDGTVRCWGDNRSRQIGDGSEPAGTTIQRLRPGRAVIGVTEAVKLNAGYEHSCAITRHGVVWCWGNNRYGQLGLDGNATLPVRVVALDSGERGEVDEVDCHGHSFYLSGYTCVRMTSGKVYCWGANINGQLGNGTLDPTPVPTEVQNLDDATQLALGAFSACALRRTGTVVCWGYDGATGALGTGSTVDNVTTPQPVLGLSEVHQIDSGAGLFCAVAGSDDRVWCWGANGAGQVGPSASSIVTTPFATAVRPVVQVRAGWQSTCALVRGGDVLCWGHNGFGQFGNGDTGQSPVTSVKAQLDGPALSFGFRWTTGCALLNNGGVQCWGENYYGILGNGTMAVNALTPVAVDWSETE